MSDLGRLRDELVDSLVTAGHLHTEHVEAAFRAVPRHLFVSDVEPMDAYADEVIVTRRDPSGRATSSSSQPMMMAIMLEQLGVEPGHRVLEIGAGTGYNAALLAHLVGASGAVTTLDIDQDLVEHARRHLAAAGASQVTVVCGDGAYGWPTSAPYDRIILAVGAQDLAPAWVDQLAPGGRLVLPLSLRGPERSVAFQVADDHLESASVVDCGFMPLRGSLARPMLVHPVGDAPGILLRLGEEREIDGAALYAALCQPGDTTPTGVRVTADEMMGGLGLWLALREPDVGGLAANGAAVERGLVPATVTILHMALTTVLIGQRAFAALVLPTDEAAEPFQVHAQAFGPDADALVRRLVTHVRAWHAAGRPSTAELHISAYLHDTARHGESHTVVDLPHARLHLDWRAQQSKRGL